MSIVDLHTVDIGDGRPLVLLMGLGAPAVAWEPHYTAWSHNRRCIAVDNRGAGDSPLGDERMTTAGMAADVAALLDRLGVARCDVAGISMGSCIAQELAISRPDLVARLVLIAPWAGSDPYTDGVLESLSEARSHATARQFNLILRNTVWTPEWINADADEQERALAVPPVMSADAFREQAAACAAHDTRTRLSSLRVPTLVTYGDQDRFIRPALSLEVADLIPDADVLSFPGLGHVHHWEDLGTFNTAIEEWLG